MMRNLRISLLVAATLMSSACSVRHTETPIRTILGGEYWWTEDPGDEYLAYLAQVRPDVIHLGVLGPEMASTIQTEDHRRVISHISPAHARSVAEVHAFWRPYLPRVQALGIRVQTTISMTNVWGDPDTGEGWFDFYRNRWDENLYGPRPVDDVMALMERGADGGLIGDGKPGWGRYAGCVNNPHFRQMLKHMVRAGVACGFDGFMVQFPHARGACVCEHCKAAFREYLRERYTPAQRQESLGIDDLDAYQITFTQSRPGMSEPIDRAARQFAALSVKSCFDEVFLEYGRSLKPDLLCSMWTHHRQFLDPDVAQQKSMDNVDVSRLVDERLLLPLEHWGDGEDYLWYSTPVYATDLSHNLLGDVTLTARYLRAMADGQPFLVLKYDYFRWRSTTGEALANGAIVFGAWKGGWSGGKDRQEPHLKTYFQFIRDRSEDLTNRESYPQVALIYPRSALFRGDATFLATFRAVGRQLLDTHVPFDVVIDERQTAESLAAYAVAILPISDDNAESSANWMDLPHVYRVSDINAVHGNVLKMAGDRLSTFSAPPTVCVHVDQQSARRRIYVHLVNYNRDESQAQRESPINAPPVEVDLVLPANTKVKTVVFHTPEVAGSRSIDFTQGNGRVQFTVPSFVAYGYVAIQY